MHPLESGPYGDERPRVLVAEDDTVTRLILKHWVIRWGYEIIVVDNGIDAWNVLQQDRPPEVVVVDWAMPGIDGIELCRRLRDKSRPYYHYILMVTASSDVQDVVHALESGADDCIGKPFGEAELRARLLVASRILALQNELIHAREELRTQAMRDGLTGVWNRTAFLDLFRRELQRADRSGANTGLLLLDLDNFKQINDTYGHLAGDQVLREVARRLCNSVRSYDFVGRYGGEEFFIALSGSNREALGDRAEAIRKAICREPVHVGQGAVPVTLSVGAAVASGDQSTSDVLAIADVGLYKAKDSGRNLSVICAKPTSEFFFCLLSQRERCGQCEAGQTNQCVISARLA
ncbi:MAG: diguanylate cyclase [Acidobacteria bacterium]|nr:diguanylate cyclase [Acidobacteriota bacterium]